MQPRCAMRFESHIPKSLAMPKSLFASDAKTHSLDLNSQENARKQKKKPAKILRCWPAMRKIGVFFKIERCEVPAIFDSRCGLACDASTRDAKSLAMWVERCELYRANSNRAQEEQPVVEVGLGERQKLKALRRIHGNSQFLGSDGGNIV